MINTLSVCNSVIPVDWIDLIKLILEPGPQLQWTSWFRGEAKNFEQKAKARGIDISQNQILGEGDYAALERQFQNDVHLLSFIYAAALNVWDRIGDRKQK